jgi:HSP20 family protein
VLNELEIIEKKEKIVMATKNLVPASKERRLPRLFEEERDFFFPLRRGINRMLDDFFGGMEPLEEDGRWFAYPRVDIKETDNEIKISAELPGMDEKDIDITIAGNTLTIKGEKKEEREEKEANYYRSERRFGSFSRVIDLPEEVDTNKVDAMFKKGVLSITLAKSERAKSSVKKIPIKSHA